MNFTELIMFHNEVENYLKKREIKMSRKNTNKLLEMLDAGLLNQNEVLLACLKYMSEDEVRDMAESNYFFEDEEEIDND